VQRILLGSICLSLVLTTARADTYLVLPFFNLTKNANLDWLGESVAETLGESLGSEGLMVLNRDDRVEAYRRLGIRPYSLLTKASVVKIGQELDAEHVIFGQFDLKALPDSAAKSRGSLTIAAGIVDLRRIKEGPEFRELGALEDLAAIEGHLAWQTLRFLRPNTAPAESLFRERHPAVRVDAIENYVRGLLAANDDEEHRFFTQAVRLDVHYSQPCFQLGRLLWKKKEYKSAGDWFQKVAPTAAHYHEANFFLGLCRYYTGDYAGARDAFQLVARVVPLNEVYNNLGAAESRVSAAEALDNFRRALEGDPNDTGYLFNVGYALWKQGNYADATRSFRAVLERDPKDVEAGLLLDRCAKQSGPRPGETRTEGLERVKTTFEESAYWQLKAVLQPEKE